MSKFNSFYNKIKNSDLRLEAFGDSEAGHRRATNEDAFLIGEIDCSHKLMAVADAFTAHGGEEASRLAVSELRDLMLMPSGWNVRQRLGAAFEKISLDIDRHFRKIHHAPPIGTTLSAVYVDGDTAYLAHVGNSRIYLVREGKVHLLTKDDTSAQILENSGAEPSASSKKTLVQALGISSELAPSLSEILLLPDDYLLLCSDGFSNTADGAEIIKTIEENASVEVAVERLIEAADARDGTDNITVVLARVCRAAKTWMEFPGFFTTSRVHS